MAVKGIDVSVFQGFNIDYNKVKQAGYSFVMPRCGYGNMVAYPYQKDPTFETNYKNAKAAGLSVGTYFYSYALDADSAKRVITELYLSPVPSDGRGLRGFPPSACPHEL